MNVANYECLEDALMFCIRASNKEIKEVAAALWHTDSINIAYSRLVDALNPKKRQKLSMDEVIFIMHFCGRYDPLYYMADKCLHDRPTKKCIETEQKEIAEKFDAMMSEAMKAYQHIIKLTKERENIENIRKGNLSFLDLEKKTVTA